MNSTEHGSGSPSPSGGKKDLSVMIEQKERRDIVVKNVHPTTTTPVLKEMLQGAAHIVHLFRTKDLKVAFVKAGSHEGALELIKQFHGFDDAMNQKWTVEWNDNRRSNYSRYGGRFQRAFHPYPPMGAGNRRFPNEGGQAEEQLARFVPDLKTMFSINNAQITINLQMGQPR